MISKLSELVAIIFFCLLIYFLVSGLGRSEPTVISETIDSLTVDNFVPVQAETTGVAVLKDGIATYRDIVEEEDLTGTIDVAYDIDRNIFDIKKDLLVRQRTVTITKERTIEKVKTWQFGVGGGGYGDNDDMELNVTGSIAYRQRLRLLGIKSIESSNRGLFIEYLF